MLLTWASTSLATKCWPQTPTFQDLPACLGARALQAHQDRRGARDSPACQALLGSLAPGAPWAPWDRLPICPTLSKAGGALWVLQAHQEETVLREKEEHLDPGALQDPLVLSTSCSSCWPTSETTSRSCRRRCSGTGLTLQRRSSLYLRNFPATLKPWTWALEMTTPEELTEAAGLGAPRGLHP